MKASRATIRDWLRKIVGASKAVKSAREAEAWIKDVTPGFASEYPAEAFTEASRDAVVGAITTWANQGEVSRALATWWAANKPVRPPLPGADDSDLTREDRLALDVFLRRRSIGFQDIPLDQHDEAPSVGPFVHAERLIVAIDLMRNTARLSRVWRYLCRTDTEIAAIALRRGWQPERSEPGWTDERAIRNTVAQIVAPLSNGRAFQMAGAMIAAVRAAVEHHAPHHMGAIDEEIAKASRDGGLVDLEQRSGEPVTVEDVVPYLQLVTADFERRHGRKPGQVTPEQLAAIRQRRPAPEIEGDGSTFSWEREQ